MKYCKKCQCETERLIDSNNRCKPCSNAKSVAYRLANLEKAKADTKAWRLANPEKYKASIAKSRAKNPEYKAQAQSRLSAWRAANQECRKSSQKVKAEKFALYEAYYLAHHKG